MNNIFKDAYFSKPYKTRDGRKAIYTIMSCDSHWLAIQDTSLTWEYNDNGELSSGIDAAMDIISEWDEEIDEEEVNKLASEYIKTKKEPQMRIASYYGFLAGYHKAKEKQL